MKIYLLRATHKNAFLMVDGKNLTVPNDPVRLTGLSEAVFGKPDTNDENSHVNEYFVQYTIHSERNGVDDAKVIQFIHKIPYKEFLIQKQDYIEGINRWTPLLDWLHIGWITPF